MVSFPTVYVLNRTIGYGRPFSLKTLTDRHSGQSLFSEFVHVFTFTKHFVVFNERKSCSLLFAFSVSLCFCHSAGAICLCWKGSGEGHSVDCGLTYMLRRGALSAAAGNAETSAPTSWFMSSVIYRLVI